MLYQSDHGSLEYERRAQLHRPADHSALSHEVQRLARDGLTALDISSALRMSLPQVRELISAAR